MSKRVLVAIIPFGTAVLCAAEPGVVAKQTRTWRTQHEREILVEFAELLAIPKHRRRPTEYRAKREGDLRNVGKARSHHAVAYDQRGVTDRGRGCSSARITSNHCLLRALRSAASRRVTLDERSVEADDARPALNVRGIESGHVGAQASNTIQTEARASIDFRLVPPEP